MPDILADFLVETDLGYYCKYGDFYIDPKHPVKTALISHAHGDHAVPGHQYIYATAGTIAFMKLRFSKQKHSSYQEVDYTDEFDFNGVLVRYYAAGHILGSAQILMSYNGVRYLYTGDYKLQEDATCEPIEFVKTDVLITETTFANPEVKHPDPIAEIKKLSETKHNIMLGCYALGKAQRIINLLNTHCPEKKIYTHHNITPINKIYESLGFVKLDYEMYHRKVMNDGNDKVYLVPPMTFNNYFKATNVLKAFASGWKRLQRHNDIELYLSDHIDWDDLLTYISKTTPSEIWTVHGEGHHLKEHFDSKITVRNINKKSKS